MFDRETFHIKVWWFCEESDSDIQCRCDRQNLSLYLNFEDCNLPCVNEIVCENYDCICSLVKAYNLIHQTS